MEYNTNLLLIFKYLFLLILFLNVHRGILDQRQISYLPLRSVQFSSVQSLILSDSLWPHEPQHARPPRSSPTPRVYSNSCPLSRWCFQPSHPLLSPSPLTFNISQHQGLFKWVRPSYHMTKVMELQLQHKLVLMIT